MNQVLGTRCIVSLVIVVAAVTLACGAQSKQAVVETFETSPYAIGRTSMAAGIALSYISDDGRRLAFSVEGSACVTHNLGVTTQLANSVEVQVLAVRQLGEGNCPAALSRQTVVVELEQPLAGRQVIVTKTVAGA